MRLIDADKIDYIMEDDENPSSFDYVRRSHIADEPTVKAIPIEWMKKWHKEEDRRIGDGWTHVEHLHSFSRMVADWEKENEDIRG